MILRFLKRFEFFSNMISAASSDELTEAKLTGFQNGIFKICDKEQESNLKIVTHGFENSSMTNNGKLVVDAACFVKECVWVFNGKYAYEYTETSYVDEFIRYVKEVEGDFEQHNYDPDGAGGGTITGILMLIDEQLGTN